MARIIPQIGGFVYAQEKDRVYVNLYAQGEANFHLVDGPKIKLTQQTEYPWEGRIKIAVDPEAPTEFDLQLRIPGWALGKPVPSDLYAFVDFKPQPIGLKINGEPANAGPNKFGYASLKRQWKKGDVVELELPMPVQKVRAHEKIKEDEGKVAVMRGPIVYCLEGVDHPGQDVFQIVLGAAQFNEERNADVLGGAVVLSAARGSNPASPSDGPIRAIPYYAWANRERGAMTVWIREAPKK